jgi:hypothetical protein
MPWPTLATPSRTVLPNTSIRQISPDRSGRSSRPTSHAENIERWFRCAAQVTAMVP